MKNKKIIVYTRRKYNFFISNFTSFRKSIVIKTIAITKQSCQLIQLVITGILRFDINNEHIPVIFKL